MDAKCRQYTATLFGRALDTVRGMMVVILSFMIVGCCSTRKMYRAVLIDRPDAIQGRLAVQIDWANCEFRSGFVHPDALKLKDAVERHPCERAELSGEAILLIYDHDFDKLVDQMEAARRAAGKHVGEKRKVQILGREVLVVDWDSQAYLASIDGKVLCWTTTMAEMECQIASAREYLAGDPMRKAEFQSGLHFEFTTEDLKPYRRSPIAERLDRIAPMPDGYAGVLRHVDSLSLKQWYSADFSNEYTRVVAKMDSERWTRRVAEAWASAKLDARGSSSKTHRAHFLESLSVTAQDNQVEFLWIYPNSRNCITSLMIEEFVVASGERCGGARTSPL